MTEPRRTQQATNAGKASTGQTHGDHTSEGLTSGGLTSGGRGLASGGHRIRTLLSVYYAWMLEYRAELFLWAVSMSLPLIIMGVWISASGNAPESYPFGPAGFARYFIAVFVIRNLSAVWVIHEFEMDVVSGRLAPMLLQPIHPLWRYVAAHLGEQWARMPLAALLVGLAIWLMPISLASDPVTGPWRPTLLGTAGALIAIYAGFAMRFLMQWAVSLLAFWVERVEKLDALIYMPYIFLSGTLAPLEVFGPAVREAIMLTPFPYTVWLPATLLINPSAIDAALLGQAVLVMAAWGLGLWVLCAVLWRQGLKRFSAMGA